MTLHSLCGEEYDTGLRLLAAATAVFNERNTFMGHEVSKRPPAHGQSLLKKTPRGSRKM